MKMEPVLCIVAVCVSCLHASDLPSRHFIPDEQRLYTDLMDGYEASVRPVMNASKKVVVNFKITLNQIVDLDERKQMLTTNVFINQEWEDENLVWDLFEYAGIKTLRVPASNVWLPDTFIFNNADDGSTGFMQGVYVLINATGNVLWPVPVKLKSSCKVDIRFFPFDDQTCILRFGSWIYSGEWMDFQSSIGDIDLRSYIDNSEWELLSIDFRKDVHTYACCAEPHPDLTYTLHMRRRTFYYIFNIIVPCIMLSILTLLTFWLPTTSGEKISLGLSVFLAFSMFMLLIAEEVPATSESVPLIGVYLTTVMTMTSTSVIMAVMVINLYNRGSKAHKAPSWLKKVVLKWLCKVLMMTHDIESLAKNIGLEEPEEAKYKCAKHCNRHVKQNNSSRHYTRNNHNADPSAMQSSSSLRHNASNCTAITSCSSYNERPSEGTSGMTSDLPSYTDLNKGDELGRPPDGSHQLREVTYSPCSEGEAVRFYEPEEEDEPVWRLRESLEDVPMSEYTDKKENRTRQNGRNRSHSQGSIQLKENGNSQKAKCRKEKALAARKEVIIEWQTMATVIDRLMFWIFFFITAGAYIVILIWIPNTKPKHQESDSAIQLTE